ncbi:hypothetical protein CPB85DRAFT_1438930 [Mucidula mucida]|nr:hypothetical protein CPB85DRAFT_1438930 [Mucidula mucida]
METISYLEQRSSSQERRLPFAPRYSPPYDLHEEFLRPPPQPPSLYHLELEMQLKALNRVQPDFILFYKLITRFNCATEPSASSIIIKPGLWPLETRMEVLKAMRIVMERWLSQLDAKFFPPMWRGVSFDFDTVIGDALEAIPPGYRFHRPRNAMRETKDMQGADRCSRV